MTRKKVTAGDSTMAKRANTSIVEQAPRAHRVLPSSEMLVHRSYGILERLMVQLEVKVNSGGELTRDDVQMFRAAQQALVDLRKDEREELKSGADDELSDEEVYALLAAKGIVVTK